MVLNVSVAAFEQNAGAVEALSQDAPGIFSPESCMRTAIDRIREKKSSKSSKSRLVRHIFNSQGFVAAPFIWWRN
jgi:hypothetical protein